MSALSVGMLLGHLIWSDSVSVANSHTVLHKTLKCQHRMNATFTPVGELFYKGCKMTDKSSQSNNFLPLSHLTGL